LGHPNTLIMTGLTYLVFAGIAAIVWLSLAFAKRKPQLRWHVLAILAVFVLGASLTACADTADSSAKESTSISYKVHHKTVRVGHKRLERAKLESKALAARAKKLSSESASIDAVSSSVASSSSSVAAASSSRAKAASSSSVWAASSSRVAASSRAASSRSASSRTAATTRSRTQHATTGNHTVTNRGDMNTAATGRIIGNKNSHIYHVPGQAGYRMNSANAVYFASEAAAKAAGYRKALR
jgi:hypothetical protein